jgi:hypothetical protein
MYSVPLVIKIQRSTSMSTAGLLILTKAGLKSVYPKDSQQFLPHRCLEKQVPAGSAT